MVVEHLSSSGPELIETDRDHRKAKPIPINREGPGRPSPSPPHFSPRVNRQFEPSLQACSRMTPIQQEQNTRRRRGKCAGLRPAASGGGGGFRGAPSDDGCAFVRAPLTLPPPPEAGGAERRQVGPAAPRRPCGPRQKQNGKSAKGKTTAPTAPNSRGASQGRGRGRRGRRGADPPTGSTGRCRPSCPRA